MSWLSPADQQVIEVARYIANEGLTLAQACARAGVSWTVQTFTGNVTRVLQNPAIGTTTAAVLQQSITMEAGAGVAAASGAAASGAAAAGTTAGAASGAAGAAGSTGLVGWILANPLLAAGALIAAGVATAVGAQLAGEYFGDEPTAVPGAGPGIDRIEPAPTIEGGGYLPVAVLVDGAVRIVSVRSVDAIRDGIPQSNFRHGGIDNSVQANLQILAGSEDRPFTTASEATEALCQRLTGPLRKPPLAAGLTAQMGGASVTVDDYGGSNIDFDRCRSVIGS